MESLISEILVRFHVQNIPIGASIESKGTFTLHADPEAKIKIRLHPLESVNQQKTEVIV